MVTQNPKQCLQGKDNQCNPGKNPVSNGNTTTASHPQPTESQIRVQPNVIAPQTQAPSQHDSTTVGKIVRSKEIPSLIGTDPKFTALVKFGHNMEECHSSKLDSLGSRTLLNTATDETGDESSASAMPEQDHDKSPTISPKVKKKKGGKKKKVAKGY
ncbi:hypothetical protein OIU77_004590 [Salix suchowensis]|uniref:Uncharacterized protein n=1 Tax=Salix suchowensis TaxID=1278906 RepID=A0ABQ9AUY6_9ROSI|nr:hypothetical protein OIU77_004590 [Salix suchowensis]